MSKYVFNYLSVFVVAGILIGVIGITGCESASSKVGGILNLDTDLKIHFAVDADINPDENNRPSPLFVRFYELKSTKLLNKADFIDLYERDEDALGAELIAKQELKRFAPGESRIEKFVISEEASHIALYAEFLRYQNSKYKIVFPVTSHNIIRNSVKVKISENEIILVDR